MATIITEWPQYFSATNLDWKKLLQPDKLNNTNIHLTKEVLLLKY